MMLGASMLALGIVQRGALDLPGGAAALALGLSIVIGSLAGGVIGYTVARFTGFGFCSHAARSDRTAAYREPDRAHSSSPSSPDPGAAGDAGGIYQRCKRSLRQVQREVQSFISRVRIQLGIGDFYGNTNMPEMRASEFTTCCFLFSVWYKSRRSPGGARYPSSAPPC